MATATRGFRTAGNSRQFPPLDPLDKVDGVQENAISAERTAFSPAARMFAHSGRFI